MIDLEEVVNRVFGPYPPQINCAMPGPQRMICMLEEGHVGTHQTLNINGFWRRWDNVK